MKPVTRLAGKRRGDSLERRSPVQGVLTMRQILDMPLFADAAVLAGAAGLDHDVQRLNMMTTPDILRWVKPNEFMLSTEYPLPQSPDGLEELLTSFARRGLAAFGVKLNVGSPGLPAAVIKHADELAFPLIQIPHDVALADILETVLSELVNRQALRIAQGAAIHDAFLDIAMSGGRLPDIAAKLSDLLGAARVTIVDAAGNLLADKGSSEIDYDVCDFGFDVEPGTAWPAGLELTTQARSVDDGECIITPIRACGVTHGRIAAFAPAWSPTADAVVAVEQAMVIAALDINRQIAMTAVERQFEANLLHDLVTSSPGDIPETLARGRSFGWRLDRPVVVVFCRPVRTSGREGDDQQLALERDIAMWSAKVRSHDAGAAVAGFPNELVAVIDGRDGPKVIGTKLWNAMHSVTRRPFSVGVSRTTRRPADIPRAYAEARKALSIGDRMSGPGRMTSFEDLGLFRLLSSIDDDELTAFLEETLAGVLQIEPEERADLLNTLEVLLDVQLNVAEAARRTDYHYNTVRYRISKLEQLVGPFTANGSLCLRLSVALQILQMQQAPTR